MYDWYPMNVGSAGVAPCNGDTFPLGNETIHGTCSLCGGPVCTPTAYWSVVPPVPTCKRCGAVKRENYGPVIDMVPKTAQDISLEQIKKMYEEWVLTQPVTITGTTEWLSTLCPEVKVSLPCVTNEQQPATPR